MDQWVPHTVYPKKYAHGFCFAVLCCGYTLTDFLISIRLTSLALWQSNDCPSASKATLMNMDKYFMWIHYERLRNHNKAKHNKTVCIFLGIYCMQQKTNNISVYIMSNGNSDELLCFITHSEIKVSWHKRDVRKNSKVVVPVKCNDDIRVHIQKCVYIVIHAHLSYALQLHVVSMKIPDVSTLIPINKINLTWCLWRTLNINHSLLWKEFSVSYTRNITTDDAS